MRNVAFALVLAVAANAAVAQDDADKCEQTEAWFKLAVDSRIMGQSKPQVRRALRTEMERKAADQLADFVFTLPSEMLTPEVAKLARQQCETLGQ